MDPEYSLTANAAIHIGLSIFDLAVNAAAGAAAASTGAHVNGDAVTNQVAYFGALGGVVKSGILNAIVLLALCTQKHWIYGIFVLATSTFGTALLTTYVMSEKIFEYVPGELLIAALAAGAPMIPGTVAKMASDPVNVIWGIGWDALTGYTFARVAQNHGFHVCEYKSAAAAGAVFGSLIWFAKIPLSCFHKVRTACASQRNGSALHTDELERLIPSDDENVDDSKRNNPGQTLKMMLFPGAHPYAIQGWPTPNGRHGHAGRGRGPFGRGRHSFEVVPEADDE